MKKLLFLMSLLIGSTAFSGDACFFLRFEAQDLLCNLEAKRSSDAVGTPDFQEALKEKMSCLESFTKTCELEEGNNDFCENIRFEGQDFICTLEAKNSSEAAGTPNFKKALTEKINCLTNFSKICSEL